MKLSPKERFFAKTVRSGDCLVWTGSRNADGYGLVAWAGKTRKAHRVAFEFASGVAVPDGMLVCHRCDNPPCVDASHLFLGTPGDNMRDAANKGRLRSVIDSSQSHFLSGHAPRGQDGSGAKLTREQAEQIIELASAGELTGNLASQFSVSRYTIQAILRGETWKDLPRPPGIPRRTGAYRRAGRQALAGDQS